MLAPLPIRDGFLLNQGFLQPRLEDAAGPYGSWQLSVTADSANSFAKSPVVAERLRTVVPDDDAIEEVTRELDIPAFVIDAEALTTRLRFSGSVTRRIALSAEVPIVSYGSAWSDPLIEDFHSSFGLEDDERPWFRRNGYTVLLAGSDFQQGAPLQGTAIGDVTISGRFNLSGSWDSPSSLAAVAAVELPTGDPETLRGSGNTDASLGLLYSRVSGRLAIHAAAHATSLGANDRIGTSHQVLGSAAWSLAWLSTPATALVLQGSISESPLAQLRFAELAPPVRQLSLGIRHRLLDGTSVHVAVGENVKDFENSSDLVIQIGLMTFAE